MVDRLEDLPPQEPYLRLIRQGVPTWNKWMKGELDSHERKNLAFHLRLNELPNADKYIDFSCVNFTEKDYGHISFEGAYFKGDSRFSGTIFDIDARFDSATFNGRAEFIYTTFKRSLSFDRARFIEAAFFSLSHFNSNHDFSTNSPGGGLVTFKHTFFEKARFNNTIFEKSVFFDHSLFMDYVSFREAKFSGSAGFSNTIFHQPPDFDELVGASRLDVTGIHIKVRREKPEFFFLDQSFGVEGWTTDANDCTRLRRLRKIMADIHAHDIERDLFILERKAERGVMIKAWREDRKKEKKDRTVPWPWGQIALLTGFDLLSDCGRSAKRPLAWFAGKLAIFLLGRKLINS